MTPPPADDGDRAAILARRQRFIAIALSGLASTAACAPKPCLDVSRPEDPQPDPTNASPDPTDANPDPTAPPQVCLNVAQPPEDDKAAPRPCLKVAKPK